MTDLAMGLSAADAAELRTIAERVEAAHIARNAAEAALTGALAQAEGFATRLAADGRASSRVQDMARRTVASEIAVALRLSDRGVQARMSDADTLVTEYPTTFAAWAAGRIDAGHMRAVMRAGALLPVGERAAFDVAAAGECECMSVPRAREAVDRLAERLHPLSATERHREARETRCVWVTPLGDGMSRVSADVPTILGEGVRDRLNRIAAALVDKREQARLRVRDAAAAGVADDDVDPGDRALAADLRTNEQIRADAFTDLVLAGQPGFDPSADADGHGDLGAIRAHVQVVVAATTLAGADDLPADLVGVAPVDAASARLLAGDCPGFDRLLVHPVSGQVLATDRYTPTLDLRRRLRARDRHCRFPRMPRARHPLRDGPHR